MLTTASRMPTTMPHSVMLLRSRAAVHRAIHAHRVTAINLEGTSEGAIKGWETRRAGGAVVESATKGRRLSSVMDQIRQPDGGFTVHGASGEVPLKGFAVSIFKRRETKIPVEQVRLKDIVAFARDNADLLKAEDNYFGAWHNPKDGQVYLDVSKVVPDRKTARKLARKHHQEAFFNFATGKSVETRKPARKAA
jgi:hypothetical protein